MGFRSVQWGACQAARATFRNLQMGKWTNLQMERSEAGTFNLEKVPNLLKDALRNVGVI